METQTEIWKDEAQEIGFIIDKFKIGGGKVSFSALVDIEKFIPFHCTDSQRWQIVDNCAYTCNCNPKKNKYEARKDDIDLWLTETRTDLQYVVSQTRKNMEAAYISLCDKFSNQLNEQKCSTNQ